MLPDYCQVSVEPPKFSSLPDKVPPFFLFFYIRGEYFLCLHSIVISGGRFDFFVPFPLLKMELVFFFLFLACFGVLGLVSSVWNIVFSLCKLMIFFFSVDVTICSFTLLLTMCAREKLTTQIEKKPKNN